MHYDINTLRTIWDNALSLSSGERITISCEDINQANSVRGIIYKQRRAYEQATGINSNIRIQRDGVKIHLIRELVNISGITKTTSNGIEPIMSSPGGQRTLTENQNRILECMMEDGWERDEAIEFLLNE